jgi:N-acetylglutamate synthase-like GNAT family acetyltransferase
MTTLQVDISPFKIHQHKGIDVLMNEIANEFTENIFSPQSKTISEVSLLATDKYWVANRKDTVIGTIGFQMLKKNNIVLKRMFLKKEFRGRGVSKALLDTLINSAIENNFSCIYLGTMTQFKAAQAFYEKNGFAKTLQISLPKDFPINPVDKVFYKKELN